MEMPNNFNNNFWKFCDNQFHISRIVSLTLTYSIEGIVDSMLPSGTNNIFFIHYHLWVFFQRKTPVRKKPCLSRPFKDRRREFWGDKIPDLWKKKLYTIHVTSVSNKSRLFIFIWPFVSIWRICILVNALP